MLAVEVTDDWPVPYLLVIYLLVIVFTCISALYYCYCWLH